MAEEKRASPRTALIAAIALAIGAAALACLCGLAALFLLQRIESLPGGIPLWRPTAVQPASTLTATPAAATPTQAHAQPPGATATLIATPMPLPTATRQQGSAPGPTHTRSPLPTPVPAGTPTPVDATPTPFVCAELNDLAYMRLAPGQRFDCTFEQEAFTALANSYEDSPCSETRFTLDNGEIRVECRMGVMMSATLAIRAQGCRVALQVLRGTLGFKKIVQELIETQFDAIRYDDICVEQVLVDDGRISVSGYGR